MYRILFSSLLVNMWVLSTHAQTIKTDSLIMDRGWRERKIELYGGYTLNRGEKNKPTNHILDIGISKTSIEGVVEAVGYSYYISNSFIMSKEGVSIAPKIGGSFSFWLPCIGSNIGYYTNFKRSTIFIEPYLGLGFGAAKIYLSCNIPLTEKNNKNVNIVSIGFSYPLYKIK